MHDKSTDRYGKSTIAISWLERVAKEALIIVPTQALIYQSWTPKLLESGYKSIGQYYAYVKIMRDPITVTTFASAIMRTSLLLDPLTPWLSMKFIT